MSAKPQLGLAGRPARLERRFRERRAEEGVDAAHDLLINVIRDPDEHTRDRLRAAEIYLDRMLGKPKQQIEHEVTAMPNDPRSLTNEELDGIIRDAEIEAAEAEQLGDPEAAGGTG